MVSALLLVCSCFHFCFCSQRYCILNVFTVTFFCTLDLRLQLIFQWGTGILVLIMCFLKKKQFATDISSKLGSSFTVVPFVIVVVSTFNPLFTSVSFKGFQSCENYGELKYIKSNSSPFKYFRAFLNIALLFILTCRQCALYWP